MSVWTSNTPGKLPKWVLGYSILNGVVNFVVAANSGEAATQLILIPSSMIMVLLTITNHIRILAALYFSSGILYAAAFLIVFEISQTADFDSHLRVSLLAVFSFLACVPLGMGFYVLRFRKNNPRGSEFEPTILGNMLAQRTVSPAGQIGHDLPRASVAAPHTDPTPDDYAKEVHLFEEDQLDEGLWAKHLIESEGDADKAKWRYLKIRLPLRLQTGLPVRQHSRERKRFKRVL